MSAEIELNELRQTYLDLGLADVITYKKFSTISIIYHSTKIEGCTLDELDTKILIEDGLTAKGKPLADHLMTEDHYAAFKYVALQAEHKAPVTIEFIQQVGAEVKRRTGGVSKTAVGTFDSSRGDLRLSSVYTDSRYYPDWSKVPALLSNLCDRINADINNATGADSLGLAVELHYGLANIHPFGDGNGRVARLLMNYIQMYHGEPLVKIFSEDRKEYLEALHKSDKAHSSVPLYEFVVAQQVKFLSEEIKKFEERIK